MPETQDELVKIAMITAPHGIKGQVKIHFHGDDPALLSHSGGVVGDKISKRLHIAVKQETSKGLICSIQGCESRNEAEKLAKTDLYIERSKFPVPSEDEETFYITDMIGLQVRDEDDELIGNIEMVDNFGAGDLLSIKMKNGKSFYLPFTKDNVKKVDLSKGNVFISPPEGYLDSI